MVERGQTLNDYVLGMSLLLLSVVLVFGLFPGIFQPFEAEIGTEERTTADTLSGELVDNSTVLDTRQTVEFDALNATLEDLEDDSAAVGIPDWMQWNATLVDDGVVLRQNGSVWRDEPAGTSVRFVALEGEDDCEHGCQLIVRVW